MPWGFFSLTHILSLLFVPIFTVGMYFLLKGKSEKLQKAVLSSLETVEGSDEFAQMERLESLTGVAIPGNLKGLQTRKELHTDVIPKDQMHSYVANI